jgi:biotin-(acetyl-CoA carboxylase) ligase
LNKWYELLETQGFGVIRAAWLARAKKGSMRIRCPEGEILGEFEDLDEQGNLCLVSADGTKHSFNTGDVFFC